MPWEENLERIALALESIASSLERASESEMQKRVAKKLMERTRMFAAGRVPINAILDGIVEMTEIEGWTSVDSDDFHGYVKPP